MYLMWFSHGSLYGLASPLDIPYLESSWYCVAVQHCQPVMQVITVDTEVHGLVGTRGIQPHIRLTHTHTPLKQSSTYTSPDCLQLCDITVLILSVKILCFIWVSREQMLKKEALDQNNLSRALHCTFNDDDGMCTFPVK